MASRFIAFLVWAAFAASLAFWGLRWLAPPTGVPGHASTVSLDSAGKGDPHRLLVGPSKTSGPAPDQAANAMLASRIKLIGVVAPQPGEPSGGVALISVDNGPPRAIRIGQVVDGANVLRALTQRGAEIGPVDGPVALTLDLPLLPPPATGVVAPANGLTINPPDAPAGMAPMQPSVQPGMQPGMPPGGVPGSPRPAMPDQGGQFPGPGSYNR